MSTTYLCRIPRFGTVRSDQPVLRRAELDLVDMDDGLARRAGHLADRHGLRGYDAVHLAAADRVRDNVFHLILRRRG